MAASLYKYRGNTPVKKGDKVVLLGEDAEPAGTARVVDTLASQFTCLVPYQKLVRFCFYADKGITWRHHP